LPDERQLAEGKKMKKRFCLFLIIFFLIHSKDAFAVQVHGPPEGFVVHIMGHIFFTAALIFLIYILHKYPIDKSKAWKYFKLSIFFWLVWNLDTFLEHIVSSRLPEHAIIKGEHLIYTKLVGPFDFERLLFYFGKFDHFLCVPAMFCLAISLKHFCRRVEKEIESVDPEFGEF